MIKLLLGLILGISSMASIGILIYCIKKIGNVCENILMKYTYVKIK